jgi:CheY-like chemotaxis protein/HPt (histidine-containing phosphotransfer) domain-containing protein
MPVADGFTLARRLKRNRALAKTKIIMLTSATNRTDSERCRNLRVAAHLNKPVKQSDLLDAIVTIFAGRIRPSRTKKAGRSKQNADRLRVLVAEDNPVNQRLMKELLKKRGYSVTLANDGKEAIDLLSKRRFDVVLMDIQMPVMGGLDATLAIRKKEKESSARIPIIATSAHAMVSDRHTALEAGMDAYLVKPILPSELYETIDRLTGRESDKPIDERSLLDGVGGDRQILRKLIKIFLEDSGRMLKTLRNAVESRNADLIAASAHALKGASANFGRNSVFNTATQLEQAGRAGQMDGIPAQVEKLEKDLAVLRKRLQILRKAK